MGVIKLQQPLTQWDDLPSSHHQDEGHMPFLMGDPGNRIASSECFFLPAFLRRGYNWIQSGKLI